MTYEIKMKGMHEMFNLFKPRGYVLTAVITGRVVFACKVNGVAGWTSVYLLAKRFKTVKNVSKFILANPGNDFETIGKVQ